MGGSCRVWAVTFEYRLLIANMAKNGAKQAVGRKNTKNSMAGGAGYEM